MAGTLIGCAPTQFSVYPSDDARLPEIDIHCHAINIRDLPAYDMMMYVFFENPILREIAGPLAKLLVSSAEEPAPTGDMEIVELERMAALGLANGFDNPDRDPVQLFHDGVDRFLRDHVETPSVKSREAFRVAQENKQALDEIYETFLPKDGERIKAFEADKNYRAHAREVAQQMKVTAQTGKRPSGPGVKAEFDSYTKLIANFFVNFVPLCSMYRYRTASYLENFVGGPRPIRLVTPACLDVTNWIKPGPQTPSQATPIVDQVRILELLSLVQPDGVALHGFVGFDPAQWVHDCRAGNDGLKVVRDAILTQGLVGVKLYPPLGFRAIGNADCWFPDHVTRGVKNFGACLDEALLTLYRFCKEHDVPIMAHCAHTIGRGAEFKNRAHPQYWKNLLDTKEFCEIRLNLAHAGGLFFWYGNNEKKPAWTKYLDGMLASGKYPNLYADVGDVANFLTGTRDEDTKELIANMRTLKPAARDRLMYGTDWPLLARLPDFNRYKKSFKPVMTDIIGSDLSKFFYGNAAAFLGLRSGMETRNRLDQFYKKNFRPTPRILDVFAPPDPASVAAVLPRPS